MRDDGATAKGQGRGEVAGRGRGGGVRTRRERSEAVADRAMLQWIGRFRFVTKETLGRRFGVSRQAAGRRVGRLEAQGLVAVEPRGMGALAGAVYLTADGARAIGVPARRPPRPDLQRRHELAIAAAAAKIESAPRASHVRVLTERDCRRLEADGRGTFHVELRDTAGKRVARWPDLVLRTARQTCAIEFEFAAKTTTRLSKIIAGYLACDWIDEVRFVVESPPLADRLIAIAARESARSRALWVDLGAAPAEVAVSVRPWAGATAEERRRIDELLQARDGRLAA